ncbi:membrane protein [Microbacterium phage Cece]|nr:membrane protein [Microbacterium phage Cece]
MIEILILSAIGAGSVGALVSGMYSWRNRGIQERKFHANPDREAPMPGRTIAAGVSQPMLEARRAEIPKDIQDEIDQSPAWWDKEFHNRLEASGAKVVARHVEEYTDQEGMYHAREYKALEGCECQNCVMVMGGTMKKTPKKSRSSVERINTKVITTDRIRSGDMAELAETVQSFFDKTTKHG